MNRLVGTPNGAGIIDVLLSQVPNLSAFDPSVTLGGAENTGRIDLLTGISSFKRRTGGYLLSVEENHEARSLIYCWKP